MEAKGPASETTPPLGPVAPPPHPGQPAGAGEPPHLGAGTEHWGTNAPLPHTHTHVNTTHNSQGLIVTPLYSACHLLSILLLPWLDGREEARGGWWSPQLGRTCPGTTDPKAKAPEGGVCGTLSPQEQGPYLVGHGCLPHLDLQGKKGTQESQSEGQCPFPATLWGPFISRPWSHMAATLPPPLAAHSTCPASP